MQKLLRCRLSKQVSAWQMLKGIKADLKAILKEAASMQLVSYRYGHRSTLHAIVQDQMRHPTILA